MAQPPSHFARCWGLAGLAVAASQSVDTLPVARQNPAPTKPPDIKADDAR